MDGRVPKPLKSTMLAAYTVGQLQVPDIRAVNETTSHRLAMRVNWVVLASMRICALATVVLATAFLRRCALMAALANLACPTIARLVTSKKIHV